MQVLEASSLGTTSNQLSIAGAGAQYRFYTRRACEMRALGSSQAGMTTRT